MSKKLLQILWNIGNFMKEITDLGEKKIIDLKSITSRNDYNLNKNS